MQEFMVQQTREKDHGDLEEAVVNYYGPFSSTEEAHQFIEQVLTVVKEDPRLSQSSWNLQVSELSDQFAMQSPQDWGYNIVTGDVVRAVTLDQRFGLTN